MARYGSYPATAAFRMKRLAIFTTDSDFPLLWARPGEEVLCLNSQALAEALKFL